MKFHPKIPVFGDVNYRGDCPTEDVEQINFYSWLKVNHPKHADLFMHPKAEGKRNGAQYSYDHRTGGIPTSMPDCMIVSFRPFCVELKRKNHTKSRWQDGQQEKLLALAEAGCFVGVALGADAMKEAFELWLNTQK